MASANPKTADALENVAKENDHALAMTGADLDEISVLASKIKDRRLQQPHAQFRDLLAGRTVPGELDRPQRGAQGLVQALSDIPS